MSKEDIFNEELQDWIEALENTLLSEGKEYSIQLLSALLEEVRARGLDINRLQNWPFKNTVLNDEEISYPGNWKYEEKIRHIIMMKLIKRVKQTRNRKCP